MTVLPTTVTRNEVKMANGSEEKNAVVPTSNGHGLVRGSGISSSSVKVGDAMLPPPNRANGGDTSTREEENNATSTVTGPFPAMSTKAFGLPPSANIAAMNSSLNANAARARKLWKIAIWVAVAIGLIAVIGLKASIVVAVAGTTVLLMRKRWAHLNSQTSRSEIGKDGVLRTKSKQIAISDLISVDVEFQIGKFDALMDIHPSGEELWSKGVASSLLPQAVWKLSVFPNGRYEGEKGSCAFFINLTGQMVESKEQLITTHKLRLVGGSGPGEESKEVWNYGQNGDYSKGWVNREHEWVKRFLALDGSLTLVGEITYLKAKK